MNKDRYYFLYSFDYYSSPFRKNPLGVLQAFRAAFGDRDENVGLVLKSIGPEENYPEIKAEIQAAITADPRIVRIHKTSGATKC